jgi:RNA polymerase sigma-70 factor (ECF subfamily)
MIFSFVFMFLNCGLCFLIPSSPRLAAEAVIPPGIKSPAARSGQEWKRTVSANDADQFERIVLPHLDAAYNLARWLAGNDHDVEDIAQEACVRAFRFIGGHRGGDGRAWLLAIVRNTAFSWLKKNRPHAVVSITDDELAQIEDQNVPDGSFQRADAGALRAALASLPLEFREAIVLRELEGLSYKEIAGVADVPVGTVMSRIARARRQLQSHFARKEGEP